MNGSINPTDDNSYHLTWTPRDDQREAFEVCSGFLIKPQPQASGVSLGLLALSLLPPPGVVPSPSWYSHGIPAPSLGAEMFFCSNSPSAKDYNRA